MKCAVCKRVLGRVTGAGSALRETREYLQSIGRAGVQVCGPAHAERYDGERPSPDHLGWLLWRPPESEQ